MATRLIRRGLTVAPSMSNELASELANVTEELSSNPRVSRFSVTVNKKTGIAKATAVGNDGKTVTRELIGPGLTATTQYTPSDKNARDANIAALYRKGLTQTEIAQQLGVSQALVSNVLRQMGLR